MLSKDKITEGKEIYIVYDYNEFYLGFPDILIVKCKIFKIENNLVRIEWVKSEKRIQNSFLLDYVLLHGHETYEEAKEDHNAFIDNIIDKLKSKKL